MKIMKKSISLFSVLFMFMAFMMVSIKADDNNLQIANISEDAEEVKPTDEMIKLADEMDVHVRTFKTKKVVSLRSTKEQTQEALTIETYFIPKDYAEVVPYTAGSKTESEDIVYYAANVYSTIYYDRKIQNNIPLVKLTKVSGGVRNLDTGWQVTNQNVMYACTGTYDGNPFATQRIEKNTSNLTYSYTCPSTWKYVNSNAYSQIGVANKVTLKHGGSSYSATVTNLY